MSLQESRSERNPTKKAAIQLVSDVFGTSEITDWHTLKKGMTNRSYAFSALGEKYIIRIPGKGTDLLINRHQEANVYSAISELGFCDNPVYINAETGYKITKYLENVRNCDAHRVDDLMECMALLRRLHSMQLKVTHTFDLFGQILFYEELWKGKHSTHHDYEEVKEKVFSLRDFIENQDRQLCLSHIDAVPDNFLFYKTESGEGLQLTDWEYAAMQDPHVDIAMFCVYSNYTRQDVDRLIDIYFQGGCDQSTRTKIYCYISTCGLLWSNWCEYKRRLGVEFRKYALRQYQYARDYYVIASQEIGKL